MQQCEQIQLTTSHIADFPVLTGKEGHYDQMHSHSLSWPRHFTRRVRTHFMYHG